MAAPNAELSVAIVGGSITGPVLGALLQRANLNNVRIYEAIPQQHTQGGGVIFLDHGSLGVLDTLGVQRSEFVDSTSERVIEITVRDRQAGGEHVVLYPRQAGTWQLIHRAVSSRLNPGTVQLGKRVTSLVQSPDGDGAMLRFADGTAETAQVIVFADGRKSTGRHLLQPNRPLQYHGWVIHRGTVGIEPPNTHDFLRFLPERWLFNTYPTRVDGKVGTYWEFDVNADESQFRAQFGAAPAKRAFMLPSHVSETARATVDEHAAAMLPPQIAQIIHHTGDRMAAAMFTIDPPTAAVHPIGNAHAVLVGDALAPMFPMTGRGANNGIEQAMSLANALRQVVQHGADLPTALAGWQERYLAEIARHLDFGKRRAAARQLGQELGDK